MKKVINITLGGIVFACENDAYDALESYLKSITDRYKSNEDRKEILEDIESALAEKFIKIRKNVKSAVTIDDVSKVTKELGNVSEFAEGEVGYDGGEENVVEKTQHKMQRRLYRNTDDVVIGGVASGIAAYLDIDPVIVRVIFFASLFAGGFGFILYILLWIIVPAAETTEQKYAMRGEKVTLSGITENVKKKIDSIDTEQIKKGAENTWGGIRPALSKVFEILGTIINLFVQLLRYIVGFAFILAGALSIAGFMVVYVLVLSSDKVFFPPEVQTALEVLTGSALGIIAMVSSFIFMAIPLIALLIVGSSLLAKKNYFTTAQSIGMIVLWIVSGAVAITTSVLQVQEVVRVNGPIEGHFENSSIEIYINDKENKLPNISILHEYPEKIVYGDDMELDQDILADDCSDRGGEFNTCGSVCPETAEMCTTQCAFTCEFDGVQTEL